VYTSTQYLLRGRFTAGEVDHIARDLLANELIQRYQIKSGTQWEAAPGFPAEEANVTGEAKSDVATIALSSMDDTALMAFSRENVLALEPGRASRDQGLLRTRRGAQAAGAKVGLGPEPTDAEIEALAQTWSEHCKHKIFNSRILYENREKGSREIIDSLFATYIQGSTKDPAQGHGPRTSASPCSRTTPG
jgi:phosphoribosylformylglycinamidine synthase subunit PurSL